MRESHGDVGSYVVHALAADERIAFEDHQDVCETCRREHEEFDETLAELAILSATAPPPQLRGDLLAAVRLIRPLPPVGRRSSMITEPPAVPTVPRMYVPESSDDELAPVIAITSRRRIIPLLATLVAAAMVAVLSLGVWVHTLGEQHQVDVTAAAEQGRLLSAPDAKIYSSTLDGSTVSYVVSKRLDRAMLIGSDMTDPGAGKAYQLWRITKAGPQPAGLIRSGGSVHQWFQGSLVEADALAVTLERSVGAQTPTLPTRSAIDL